MEQARIHLELPRGRWKADVSRGYPDLSFQLLGMVMSDDRAVETVVGTHAAISELGDQLQTDGFGFEVAYIRSDHDVSEVLTDRQAEVLFTAVEHGYYRSPRQCTLTEVAEVLGIAKSTCSGTLQRAEEAVIEYFCLQQRPPGEESKAQSPAVGGRSGD